MASAEMRGGLSASNIQVAPWMGMALLLAVYVWDVASLHPANLFGAYNDDSVYFASAKALAQGRGYIMPNFPGAPPQAKYPILYPWMLSRIWRMSPAFPRNVIAGIGLTVFFGCWSLIAAFQILRRLGGIGDWTALLLVAFCALQPMFLTFSGRILSDLPFMALALTALALADSAIAGAGSMPAALLAGAVAGLSVGARTMGLAVVAGVLAAAVYRRAMRQGLTVLASALAVVAACSWRQWMNLRALPLWMAAFPSSAGWRQNVAYETSYGAIWRVCVPNFHAFVAMLKTTVPSLILAPGGYLVAPLEEPQGTLALAAATILTVAMISGMIRQARAHGWRPIHFALPFYCLIVLVWPYPMMGRYLLPFLPLFMAGLWVELLRFGGILWVSRRTEAPSGDKILAGVVAIAAMCLFGFAGWKNLVEDRRWLSSYGVERGKDLQQQLEAYAWIREHTAPNDRVVAFEDSLLYLYTGREAVRPAAILPAFVYFEDGGARANAAALTDTAHDIAARFWVFTGSDYANQGDVSAVMAARMADIRSVLPRVFRSSGRTVEIYDSSCVAEPQEAQCRSAARILFPASQ